MFGPITKPALAIGSILESTRRDSGPYDPAKPFNQQIRAMIRATHPKDGPLRVVEDGKRFEVVTNHKYWSLYSEGHYIDGIGTKGHLHWLMDTVENGVRDAFAMTVDDAIESGRVPVSLSDHLIVQEEDQGKIFRIVKTLVELSTENTWRAEAGWGEGTYPIAITAGETAVMNTIQGFELGVGVIAYVRNGHKITANVKAGDVLIGIGSSGVHSNGLSFFRSAFRYSDNGYELPWGRSVGEELTIPTRIYLPAIKAVIAELDKTMLGAAKLIHGMVHITGGGMSKLRELIDGRNEVDIHILRDHQLQPQEIFRYTHEKFNVPSNKMYTRFNNGVGFVVAVDAPAANCVLSTLRSYFPADVIGAVTSGTGKVRIDSCYEPVTVEY